MGEPLVEVVYGLSEEDLLQHVRVKLKSRFKDPMFRTKVGYILNFILVVVGVILLVLALLPPWPIRRSLLLYGLWFMVIGNLNGHRTLKRYRGFYQKLKAKAKTTDWLVFRAYPNGFTITKPGISESSINWTAIKFVNLNADYLNIFTKEDTMFRVPRRCIRQDQWDVLKILLHTVLD